MAWIDLTEDLTEAGKKLPVGEVLFFKHKKAGPIHLKIMRKAYGKVWAKRTYLYLPSEVEVTDKTKIDKI